MKRGGWKDDISNELGISTSKIYKLLYIDDVFPELIDMIDDGRMTIHQSYVEAKRRKIQNTIDDNKDTPNKPSIITTDRFTIYNKSSAEMTELEDKSVDMVMTSPPYYSLRNYGKDGQIGLEDSIEDYISNLMLIFDESYRVLKDDGACCVVGVHYFLFAKFEDFYTGSSRIEISLVMITARHLTQVTPCALTRIYNERLFHTPNSPPIKS